MPKVAEILVQRILASPDKGAYQLHEFVVMQNHFHHRLTPGETTCLEKTVQLSKGRRSCEIRQQPGNKMEFWQVRLHDLTIRDSQDYRTKVRYIQMNPVQSPLVERLQEWPFGSACGKFVLDSVPDKFKS